MIDKKNKKGSKDIRGVFALVFFAVVTAVIFNHMSPSGIALFGQWETQKGVVSANPKTNPINNSIDIHSAQLVSKIIKEKQRTIIDVRAREVFDMGHIPTAVSFPLVTFDDNFLQMLSTIKQHDPVLLYCSSVYCTDSHSFADLIMNMGYTDVKVFSGGFDQWQEKGYEIEKNKE